MGRKSSAKESVKRKSLVLPSRFSKIKMVKITAAPPAPHWITHHGGCHPEADQGPSGFITAKRREKRIGEQSPHMHPIIRSLSPRHGNESCACLLNQPKEGCKLAQAPFLPACGSGRLSEVLRETLERSKTQET